MQFLKEYREKTKPLEATSPEVTGFLRRAGFVLENSCLAGLRPNHLSFIPPSQFSRITVVCAGNAPSLYKKRLTRIAQVLFQSPLETGCPSVLQPGVSFPPGHKTQHEILSGVPQRCFQ